MSLSERATRKRLIDQALQDAGWGGVAPYRGYPPPGPIAIAEHPTANGPADYVLFDQGKPLAIVEAKRPSVGAQNVLVQAQRYSQGLRASPFDFHGHHVPFAYSTNGYDIWFQDLRDPHSRSRSVQGFHTPAALRDLRQKLAARPEGFTEDRLRRAYQHELADIISIIKHAARGEPLLSAEERVDQALRRVRGYRRFTVAQEKWLALIRDHLVENLAIERADFDLITFARRGATWRRVDRDFHGELEELLARINEAMAA